MYLDVPQPTSRSKWVGEPDYWRPVEGGGSMMAGRGPLVWREESVWGRDLKAEGVRKPSFKIYIFFSEGAEKIYYIILVQYRMIVTTPLSLWRRSGGGQDRRHLKN